MNLSLGWPTFETKSREEEEVLGKGQRARSPLVRASGEAL